MKAQLNALLEKLGHAGVAALGIAVFATAFYTTNVAPARARLVLLQTQAAELHMQSRKIAGARSGRAESPLERVDGYYGSFPGMDGLTEAVGDTLAAAKDAGLNIEQAEYNYEAPDKRDIAAYQMRFTVKAPYARVRGFLVEALKAHPAMSLDELTLRRDNTGSADIEARISLTFYATSVSWNARADAG